MTGRLLPLLLLLLVGILPVAYGQQQSAARTFSIDGTLAGAAGKKLTLINGDNNKKVDHITLSTDTFHLKGKAAGMTVFALQTEERPMPLLLVVQGGDRIHIQGQLADFPLATVTGNDQSVTMQQYQKQFMPLLQQAQRIHQRAAALTAASDSATQVALQNEARVFNSELQSTGIAFIQYHPDAIASVFALMNSLKILGSKQLNTLYQSLSDSVKNSRYGKMVAAEIDRVTTTAIGATAPDFTLKDVDGQVVNLSDFRGQYVLVDFWASWCGPCRMENPNVVAAYKAYQSENFTVLGVSLDEDEKSWKDAIEQDQLHWTQVSDLQGWNNAAARLYHVNGIPTNFLLDPSGKIIGKNLRGAALEQKLAEIFNREP